MSLSESLRSLIPESGRQRGWRPLAIRAGFTALLLGGILLWLPLEELLAGMRRVSLSAWLVLFFGSFAAHIVAAGKWRVLLGASGIKPDLQETLRAHFSGLFANLFLPTLVGGDVVRAGFLVRRHPGAPLVAGSLADRVLDTAALITLSSIGALMTPSIVDSVAGPILTAAIVALVVGCVAAPMILNHLDPARLPDRLAGFTAKFRDAVNALIARPAPAILAWLLAIGIQGSYVMLNAQLGRTVGIDLPVAVWFLCWPLAKLAGLLPISLGGLGVRETALAGLLLPFGIPATLAVAQSLVWETTVVALGIASGLLASWLGQRLETSELGDGVVVPE